MATSKLTPFDGKLDDEQPASTLTPFTGQLDGEKPRTRGLFEAVNDNVIEFANAAAGGVSALANFVKPGNAVSGFIDENIIKAGEQKQSDVVQGAKRQLSEGLQSAQGIGDEVGAVGSYVLNNPLLAASQAAGSFALPGGAVKGAGAAAKALGAGVKGVETAGRVGGIAAGAAMAGGDAAGTAYDLASKAGATDEQATAAGRQASVIPAIVGGVTGAFGAERLLAGAKGFGGNALSRGLKSGLSEAGQEALEEGVTQFEGQRAAMPYDATIDPTKGVAGAAAMGGIMGFGPGAVLGAMGDGSKPSQQMGIDPNAGPLSRAAASAVDSQPVPPADPTQSIGGSVTGTAPESLMGRASDPLAAQIMERRQQEAADATPAQQSEPIPLEQRSLDELRQAFRSAQDPAIRKTLAAEIRKRREAMPDPLASTTNDEVGASGRSSPTDKVPHNVTGTLNGKPFRMLVMASSPEEAIETASVQNQGLTNASAQTVLSVLAAKYPKKYGEAQRAAESGSLKDSATSEQVGAAPTERTPAPINEPANAPALVPSEAPSIPSSTEVGLQTRAPAFESGIKPQSKYAGMTGEQITQATSDRFAQGEVAWSVNDKLDEVIRRGSNVTFTKDGKRVPGVFGGVGAGGAFVINNGQTTFVDPDDVQKDLSDGPKERPNSPHLVLPYVDAFMDEGPSKESAKKQILDAINNGKTPQEIGLTFAADDGEIVAVLNGQAVFYFGAEATKIAMATGAITNQLIKFAMTGKGRGQALMSTNNKPAKGIANARRTADELRGTTGASTVTGGDITPPSVESPVADVRSTGRNDDAGAAQPDANGDAGRAVGSTAEGSAALTQGDVKEWSSTSFDSWKRQGMDRGTASGWTIFYDHVENTYRLGRKVKDRNEAGGGYVRGEVVTKQFKTADEAKAWAKGQADTSKNAIDQPSQRPDNWRGNAIKAGKVARSLGLDPKGKRLKEIVAEIDAVDAGIQPATPVADQPQQQSTLSNVVSLTDRLRDKVRDAAMEKATRQEIESQLAELSALGQQNRVTIGDLSRLQEITSNNTNGYNASRDLHQLLKVIRTRAAGNIQTETPANVKNAPQAANDGQAKASPVEARAPEGGNAAADTGVPAAPGAGDVQADGVKEEAKKDAAPAAQAEPEQNKFAEYDALARQYGYEVRQDGSIGSNGKFPGVTMSVKKGRLRFEGKSGNLLASYAPVPESLGKFLKSFWYAEKKTANEKKPEELPMPSMDDPFFDQKNAIRQLQNTINSGVDPQGGPLREERREGYEKRIKALQDEIARAANIDAAAQAEKPAENDAVAKKPYDAARAQELRNSIAEGELILSSGTNNGRKLTKPQLDAVRRSVDSSRSKLAELDEDDAFMGVDGTPAKPRKGKITAEQYEANLSAWANGAPKVFSEKADDYAFKSGQSVLLEAFHGTGRGDRVGTKFLKKRATSGPMSFFTSSPELAAGYATGKQDTSLSYEDISYADWFKYQPKGQRSPIPLDRAWYFMDAETKQRILDRMPDIRTDDDGNIIYEEGGGDIGSYEWNLKQTQKGFDKRGNPLAAAIETWLMSGSLFGEEQDFMKVLKLAGVPVSDITYDNPGETFPFVYKTWVRMSRPLVTSDVPVRVEQALRSAALKDRSRSKAAGADMWDKNTRTLRDWVNEYFEPSSGDNKYVWTSIPDKVTEVLQSEGYDGIVDWSGKGGGATHPVYIPFEQNQVKSAIGNSGKFDPSKDDIMAFGTKDRGQGTPVDRAIMDMAGEGREANEILSFIAKSSKSPYRRQLAQKLLATGANPAVSLGGEMGGGAGFRFLAKYSRKNHEVTLSEAAADRAEQIFLHETVHAATLLALDKGGLIATQMNRLYESVKAQGGAEGQYGLKNVGEFVAEAFTNPEFQKALKGMKADNGSLWDRLVNIVRRILGMEPRQQDALSKALELGAGVMRENIPLRAAKSFRAEDGPAFAGADQTETPEFKRWFGDSKVVDANGKPLLMYHGTAGDFKEFKRGVSGEKATNTALYGEGFYFTESPAYANAYATGDFRRQAQDRAAGGNIMPVYLDIKNPFIVDRTRNKAMGGTTIGDLLKAEENGYDGVLVYDSGKKGRAVLFEAVAFRPEQIKSAIGNNGNFDPDDADIAHFGIADAVEQIKAFDVKEAPKNTWAHYRGMALQALGRRQLVDLYGDEFGTHLHEYDTLVQQMDAEKNETGAEADDIAQRWGKLKDEKALAELMHDATLSKIDPDKPMPAGYSKAEYDKLKTRFNTLSPEAKTLYREARDMYVAHYKAVQQAIKDRIERSEMSPSEKKRMMAQLDDKLFKELQGVYFPLARFGQYVIVVKDANGEVKNVTRAETVKEAEQARKELQKAFPAHMGNTVGKVLKQAEFNAGRDAVGKGFMADLMNALDEKGVDDELRDTVAQLYLSSLPDLSWAKHGIHRKGTPGFSQDARRAFAQNAFHGARYLAKLRYSDRLQDELTGMQEYVKAFEGVEEYDSIQGQQVVDEMVKRHEILMNPKSSPVSTALTSFGFLFHMGLSPASAMVNLTQTALVAYPQMGAKWGFGKAGAALTKASEEVVRAKNDLSKSLKGAELAAFERAVRDGTIDVTMSHDLAGIAQGEDQGVMWKIRPVMRWASFMFHHAEKFNRQATFLAAYRLSKQTNPEKSEDWHYESAKKVTYDGHYDYSAANRPRMMQGNWQRVILLFKAFAQNTIYTLARNAYQSVKAIDPKERAQARKTLGGILAAHAAAAGVLGLPIVGPLLTVASWIGGDDDEPWDAEVAMQNAMAEMIGPKAAEVVARGFSRLTPFDLSGRVALNKLILPDVQEGLEGKEWAESAMAAALGPVAGIGVNMARGAQKITEGDYLRGLEDMMPTALRGPLKALRYANEGAVDKTGIVITDEVSAAGVLGQASGFSPSQVLRDTERRSAIYAYDRALLERRSVLMRMMAEARIQGDTETQAEVQKDIQRFNEKNPARRITPMNIAQSVRNRRKRIDEAEQGVYLPSKRRDALDAVSF